MEDSKYMLNADEVSKMLNISKGLAYKLIRRMNFELEKEGYIVVAGKIPKAFISEKLYGYGKDD